MIEANILYSGTVQGVGFRYTVLHHANDLQLKGWVRNLADGKVEILVEGEKQIIDRFCEQIEKYFEGYIRDKEFFIGEWKEKYKDFKIIQ